MFAKVLLSVSTMAVLASVSQAAPAAYVVDKDHSNVRFSVRHLMITDVIGKFRDFQGSFTYDRETGALSDGKFVVKTASVDTDNEKRDEHLRSPDFFDSAKHDSMTFTKTKLEKIAEGKYKWSGDLTIRGKTKPVTFDLTETGMQKDPWGNQRLGFHAEAKINRKDFGLKWNKAIEGGGVTVGEEVKIIIDASTIQQKAEAAATEKKK